MVTQQGDLSLLNDPVAQRLLQSRIPARLAYVWSDGPPRVVPIGFHWNGSELVLGTPTDAPKMEVLEDGTKVALSIDSDAFPYDVLLIRGSVRTEIVDGIAPEYVAMTKRTMGEEQSAVWLANMSQLVTEMACIFIQPEWVAILDFETRFPVAVERAAERAESQVQA